MLSTENVKFEYKGKTYTRNFLAKEAEKNNMEVDAYINVLIGRGMKQISEPAEMIDGGFFEDLWKSATQGWAAGASVNESFDIYKKGANVSDEELQAFIDAAIKMNASGPTHEQLMFQKEVEKNGGGFFGGLSAIANNFGYLPQLITSSMATMISSFVDSEEVAGFTAAGAAAGAGTGAGVGTAFAGVGAAPGAVTGALMGATAGLVGAMETGLTLTDLLKEELEKMPEGQREFNK